jgi:predicted dehydrogenase
VSQANVRVGVLGLSHDHVWGNLDALVRHPEASLVAAGDTRSGLREKARKYGCKLYDDPQQVLDSVDLDAVYVFSDNRQSAELATQAARLGLHVMLEKPMAADYIGAVELVAAAHASKTKLMVNWPFVWWASLQYALGLIADGRIGRIFQVHYRAAHAGPLEVGCSPAFSEWLLDPHRNGSGVLMDYCSYGAALACLLLGLPSRVTAVTGRAVKLDLPAEDNAVVVMQHADAISTSVGSWTQIGHLTSYVPTFYGTDGTLVVTSDSVTLVSRDSESGVALDIPPPATQYESSATFFVHHILSGDPITGLCSPTVSLAAQHVLAAALTSAREGTSISLPLATCHLRAQVGG